MNRTTMIFSVSTIVAVTTFWFAFTNAPLAAGSNLSRLNYDNLFDGKCREIEGFTNGGIDQIFGAYILN